MSTEPPSPPPKEHGATGHPISPDFAAEADFPQERPKRRPDPNCIPETALLW